MTSCYLHSFLALLIFDLPFTAACERLLWKALPGRPAHQTGPANPTLCAVHKGPAEAHGPRASRPRLPPAGPRGDDPAGGEGQREREGVQLAEETEGAPGSCGRLSSGGLI